VLEFIKLGEVHVTESVRKRLKNFIVFSDCFGDLFEVFSGLFFIEFFTIVDVIKSTSAHRDDVFRGTFNNNTDGFFTDLIGDNHAFTDGGERDKSAERLGALTVYK